MLENFFCAYALRVALVGETDPVHASAVGMPEGALLITANGPFRFLSSLPPERYITVPEFARMIRVPETTAHRLVRSGALPAERTGGTWRIRASVAEDCGQCLVSRADTPLVPDLLSTTRPRSRRVGRNEDRFVPEA